VKPIAIKSPPFFQKSGTDIIQEHEEPVSQVSKDWNKIAEVKNQCRTYQVTDGYMVKVQAIQVVQDAELYMVIVGKLKALSR
jgi:hypothetical protein